MKKQITLDPNDVVPSLAMPVPVEEAGEVSGNTANMCEDTSLETQLAAVVVSRRHIPVHPHPSSFDVPNSLEDWLASKMTLAICEAGWGKAELRT